MATQLGGSEPSEGADAAPRSAWPKQMTSDRSDAPAVDGGGRVGAAVVLGDTANASPQPHGVHGDAAHEEPLPKLPGLESY
jgi:hypothetical protein